MSATRLARLQAELKARTTHPGPEAGQTHGALTSIALYHVKIAAFVLLDKGWSVARVAAHLMVDVESLQRWVDDKCPLI